MSSVRAMRRRMCESKRAYRDLAEASAAAHGAELRGEPDVHVYRCPLAKHWHIGHQPADVRRAIAERRSGRP